MRIITKKRLSICLCLLLLLSVGSMLLAGAQSDNTETTILWDFEDDTVQGWEVESPTGMTIKNEPIGTNNHALRLMHTYKDKEELTWWDQSSIHLTGKRDLTNYRGVVFDVILNISAIDGYGKFHCQVNASTESWQSYLHFSSTEIAYTPMEDGDSQFVKVKCISEIPAGTGVIEQLSIWVVGAAIDYDQPIYIDNIGFTTNLPETQEVPSITPVSPTPVEKYGQLQVIGTQLCAQDGTPVQLRGMSFPMTLRNPDLVNRAAMQAFAYDWKCDIVRISVDVGGTDYTGLPEQKELLFKAIDLARETGMYVLLDWHVLTPGNPLDPVYAGAADFFDEFSKKYGNLPNIIYEICNEPNGNITWKDHIKPYAESIIPVIRGNDSDSVIVVGTGTWSQDVDVPADNPINDENIMYTLHFYAGTHTQSLRDKASYAIKKGLALFVTEWGTTSATGANGIFLEETDRWIDFMDTHKLSWTNWSFSNSAAESSILKSYITTGEEDGLTIKSETSTAPTEKNSEGFYYWPTEQLKPSAIYVRNLILAAHPAEELPLTITSESSLQSNELTITANAQGGNQKYQYSYYILKDGKIYYQNLLTDHTAISRLLYQKGAYHICVYVQDSAGNTAKSYLTVTV